MLSLLSRAIFILSKLRKGADQSRYRPSTSGRLHVAVDLQGLLSGDLKVEDSGVLGRIFLLEVGARDDGDISDVRRVAAVGGVDVAD